MNDTTVTERKTDKPTRTSEFISVLTQILLYSGIAIGAVVLLVLLYQAVKYLFVVALLFIAWLGPVRWRG